MKNYNTITDIITALWLTGIAPFLISVVLIGGMGVLLG